MAVYIQCILGVSEMVIQQTLYILVGLTLLMLIIVAIAWRVLRINHGRRKMSSLLATKQQILGSQGHDIDLKITPIGDSTLRVIFTASCSNCSELWSVGNRPFISLRSR